MHYNHFSCRIYVEKISEQWNFGYYNSQKAERGVWWDGYKSGDPDDQQVEGLDDQKGAI